MLCSTYVNGYPFLTSNQILRTTPELAGYLANLGIEVGRVTFESLCRTDEPIFNVDIATICTHDKVNSKRSV